jgi:hypothetical protein
MAAGVQPHSQRCLYIPRSRDPKQGVELIQSDPQAETPKSGGATSALEFTAVLLVNGIDMGTFDEKGIHLRKPLPEVIGPISNMTGYLQGALSIPRTGAAYLSVSESVPTDSAVKKGIKGDRIDN